MNLFTSRDKVVQLKLSLIQANGKQPRSIFDDEKINELASSIKMHGVLQPIIVRAIGNNKYEIVAGERRYRACQMLNFETIPAIAREYNDEEAASVSLIENIQREDLTAIEEAKAYKAIMELHNLKQEELAERIGKSQSTIANKIRLLNLPEEVQNAILQRKITERHARALLMLKDEEQQLKVLNRIIEKDLTVKETENYIKKLLDEEEDKPKGKIISKISRDARIAINTINHAINMVREQSGLELETIQSEDDKYVIYEIKIPKFK